MKRGGIALLAFYVFANGGMTYELTFLFILCLWAGITGALAAIAELTMPRQSKQARIVERVVEFTRAA